MAEQGLIATSAFLHWTPITHPAFEALPRESVTLASFAAVRGQEEAVRTALSSRYGLALPSGPRRAEGDGIAVVWAGPGQWLAIAERGAGRDLESELKGVLGARASVVDQSDGRVIVQISGPKARDVLAKGVPVDLHPRAFKAGDVAITHASHIGVILWQVNDAPTYEVAMFRSYADSFAHWLDEAAAEFV